MRVKIHAYEQGIDKLRFGKTYYIAYAGITYGETFVFTRKNRVELCEFVNNRKVSSRWVSKRELKQMLEFIHWLSESETKDKA